MTQLQMENQMLKNQLSAVLQVPQTIWRDSESVRVIMALSDQEVLLIDFHMLHLREHILPVKVNKIMGILLDLDPINIIKGLKATTHLRIISLKVRWMKDLPFKFDNLCILWSRESNVWWFSKEKMENSTVISSNRTKKYTLCKKIKTLNLCSSKPLRPPPMAPPSEVHRKYVINPIFPKFLQGTKDQLYPECTAQLSSKINKRTNLLNLYLTLLILSKKLEWQNHNGTDNII